MDDSLCLRGIRPPGTHWVYTGYTKFKRHSDEKTYRWTMMDHDGPDGFGVPLGSLFQQHRGSHLGRAIGPQRGAWILRSASIHPPGSGRLYLPCTRGWLDVGTCWNLLEPVGTCWECERTWKSWDLEEVDQSFPEKAKETVVYVVTQFLALTNLIHSAIVEDLTLLSQFLSPAFYSFRTGCSAPIKAPFGFEWIFIAREVLQALQTSSAFSGVIAQLWQPSQVSYSLGTQDGKDSPKWRRAIFARNSWTTPPKPWFSGGSTHIWYRGMG